MIEPTLERHKVVYEIDNLLAQNGIDVLRLPPYHCQYNPIELAWAYCKSYYNKFIQQNSTDKGRVANLWTEALSHFSPNMWANSIKHCENLIAEDWRREMGNCTIFNVPPIIIRLGEDSESESEGSYSDLENEDQNESENTNTTNNCSSVPNIVSLFVVLLILFLFLLFVA